jgi:hypothetical protein
MPEITCFQTMCGGEAGIRTPAPVTRPNGLANRPLRPTWVLLLIKIIAFINTINPIMAER